MHTVNVIFKEGMMFEAAVNGHKIVMDADQSNGGNNQGPRPKPLVLAALGGCTGMDVVAILKKMRVELEYFNVLITAETNEDHPRVYHKIHIEYQFRGKNLPMEKLEKAISLSQERYCGVSAMLRKAAALTYQIRILE